MGIIKRTGGVFGRNPTFNKIIVEGASEFSASNAPPITVDRLSSDGPIFVMDRDGVEIGDINTTSTATSLQIRATKNASQLEFHAKNSSGSTKSIRWDTATSTNGSLRPNEDATANLGLSNRQWNDLYLSGDVILASGSGIDFSATAGTGTSELLDDYEEGVFTVALAPSTSGTITINSSYQTLYYTKIGRVVYITGQIRVSAVSSPVGVVNITNLPFVNSSASQTPDTNFVTTQVIGAAADPQSYSGYIFANSSTIILYKNGNQTSAADFSGNEYISISGFYCAAT
jgi:hypothetical protein